MRPREKAVYGTPEELQCHSSEFDHFQGGFVCWLVFYSPWGIE